MVFEGGNQGNRYCRGCVIRWLPFYCYSPMPHSRSSILWKSIIDWYRIRFKVRLSFTLGSYIESSDGITLRYMHEILKRVSATNETSAYAQQALFHWLISCTRLTCANLILECFATLMYEFIMWIIFPVQLLTATPLLPHVCFCFLAQNTVSGVVAMCT